MDLPEVNCELCLKKYKASTDNCLQRCTRQLHRKHKTLKINKHFITYVHTPEGFKKLNKEATSYIKADVA